MIYLIYPVTFLLGSLGPKRVSMFWTRPGMVISILVLLPLLALFPSVIGPALTARGFTPRHRSPCPLDPNMAQLSLSGVDRSNSVSVIGRLVEGLYLNAHVPVPDFAVVHQGYTSNHLPLFSVQLPREDLHLFLTLWEAGVRHCLGFQLVHSPDQTHQSSKSLSIEEVSIPACTSTSKALLDAPSPQSGDGVHSSGSVVETPLLPPLPPLQASVLDIPSRQVHLGFPEDATSVTNLVPNCSNSYDCSLNSLPPLFDPSPTSITSGRVSPVSC